MSKKSLLAISVLIVFVFGFFYLIGRNLRLAAEDKFTDKFVGEKRLVLVLDYGDNRKQEFEVSGEKEWRAWNLLQQASAVSSFYLEPTEDFHPKQIDGLANGERNREWNFYVNGVKQKTSPYEIFVKPPAKVAFKFE